MRDELARLLALPRLVSQRGVLLSVVAGVVAATTLVATGPVLATAVSEGGLRASLGQAQPREIGVEVDVRTTASRAPTVEQAVAGLLVERLGDLVDVPDVAWETGTLALPDGPDDLVVPLGRPPRPVGAETPRPRGTDAPLLRTVDEVEDPSAVGVRVHAGALDALDVRVGGRVLLSSGAVARVVGTFEPVDVTDRRWWGEPTWRDAVTPGVAFREVGPLVPDGLTLAELVGEADPNVTVTVRTLPRLDAVTPDRLVDLRRRLAALPGAVDGRLGPPGELAERWTVRTPLADASAAATVSLAATRASVLAAVGQVAVLALYALGLAGRLLRSGREVETLLLRARGATPRQLGLTAAVEGLVVVVPAVLAAPFLALATVAGLGRLDVVADAGLVLDGRVGPGSVLGAVVAGVACLVVLVAPAVASARRTYASTRGAQGRRTPVGAVQDRGLDLALVVVAAIGTWQLRSAGGPVGSVAPRGPGDVDPLLVLAPAVGLAAGALLVLRVVPALAGLGERVASATRGLVAGLSGWQLARRPDAVSRPTLLLVLGVAVGVLAVTYDATWTASQQDQADAAVGADLRVEPDRRPGALPDARAVAVLGGLERVTSVRPVTTAPVVLAAGGRDGTVVGVDVAGGGVTTRADGAPTVPLRDLDVPPLAAPGLPGAARLALEVEVADDPRWPGRTMPFGVVLRDGRGLVHRLERAEVRAGAPTVVAWDVEDLEPPLALLALEFVMDTGDALGEGFVPGPAVPEPVPPLLDVRIGPPTADGVAVPTAPSDWALDPSGSTAPVPPVLDDLQVRSPGGFRVTGTTGLGDIRTRRWTLRVVAVDAAVAPGVPPPAVVTPAVLAATGREVGDVLSLSLSGVPLQAEVVGTLPFLPGAVEARPPVVVDVDAVAAARWASDRAETRPSEWRLDLDETGLDPAGRRALAERLLVELAGDGIEAADVEARALDALERRRDPIAVGLLAALVLGALAAVGLALLGTVATAVVGVRERAAEFALLQAVGTTVRQLRRGLASEVATVVVTGVVGGATLGAVLVWAVLPTIALAADGTPAVPAPVVVVPWATLLAAVAVVVVAFAAVPFVLARVVARAHVAEVLRLGEDA